MVLILIDRNGLEIRIELFSKGVKTLYSDAIVLPELMTESDFSALQEGCTI